MRKMYGRAFFLISAYSARETRVATLSRRIGTSRGESDLSKHRHLAEELNARDEQDRDSFEQRDWGQNVRGTFPDGDLFVDADDPTQLRQTIRRFVEALFGYQFHTPSRDEYGMFLATAARHRSADLSRQVGAVVTTTEGDVIAVGCNEVPKAGGGLYWSEDPGDSRDFRSGKDINHELKDLIIREIISKFKDHLQNKGEKAKEQDENPERPEKEVIGEIFERLDKERKMALEGARITGLLEFGRTVHAEMAALADAAFRGVSVKGATMYVTTFPCHMCARHIVASGLRRVVYIEPYPKSMVSELYPDSISIGPACGFSSVKFEPFLGFSPKIYVQFFEIPEEPERENSEGVIIPWDRKTRRCRIKRYVASYLFIELRVVGYLAGLLSESHEIAENFLSKKTKWRNLVEPKPLHSKTNICEWLKVRKKNLDRDLNCEESQQQPFPGWLKMAIRAHKYF